MQQLFADSRAVIERARLLCGMTRKSKTDDSVKSPQQLRQEARRLVKESRGLRQKLRSILSARSARQG